MSQAPDDLDLGDLEAFKSFFLRNHLPGLRTRDLYPKNLEVRSEIVVCKHSWAIAEDQESYLESRCELPENADSQEDGFYSLQIEEPGHNNCVSWSQQVTDEMMDSVNRLGQRTYSVKRVIGFLCPEMVR